MADESDDRPAYTSKLGDGVKTFMDEVKPITDLLPSVVTMAVFIGGILLVSYAAKEHFFYDLSSVAAIGLLLFTFFTFSFFLIALVIYSFLCTLWIAVVIYQIKSWYRHKRGRPPLPRQLRPEITSGRVAFSFLLFLWLSLLIVTRPGAAWLPITEYAITTGVLLSMFVAISPLPGESVRRRMLLFAFLGLPILMLFAFSGPTSVFGSLLNSTMTFLSFRSAPDQLVRLNEQAYHKVRDIAAYAGINISSCRVEKDFWVLREVMLIWHGIEATAYLRVERKPDASVLIPLPSDAVEVLYLTGIQLPQHCVAGYADLF